MKNNGTILQNTPPHKLSDEMTTSEFVKYSGLSDSTISEWARNNLIPSAFRNEGRVFKRSAVDKAMALREKYGRRDWFKYSKWTAQETFQPENSSHSPVPVPTGQVAKLITDEAGHKKFKIKNLQDIGRQLYAAGEYELAARVSLKAAEL